MQRFPDLDEGELSRSRASLVNETQLAKMSRSLDFGDFICLGKGELQTNGREKNSILADTFEALMAAIYLDGGFQAAFDFIETHFQPLLEKIKTGASGHDFKSQLQEFVQEGRGALPNYRIVREDGPDHDKTFWVALQVFEIEVEGVGKNKKTAEQEAARKALEIFKAKDG
jgi:ribonuclease-3